MFCSWLGSSHGLVANLGHLKYFHYHSLVSGELKVRMDF